MCPQDLGKKRKSILMLFENKNQQGGNSKYQDRNKQKGD